MIDYVELAKIHSIGKKKFSVKKFEGYARLNRHSFIVLEGNREYFLGHLTPRSFIDVPDNIIPDHVSRTQNWDLIAEAGELFWWPIEGDGERGRFLVNGKTCDEGMVSDKGMKRPRRQPPSQDGLDMPGY